MTNVWKKFLRTALGSVIDQEVSEKIEKIKEETVSKELSKIAGQDTLSYTGAGKVSAKDFSRGVSYETLRSFSRLYPILRSCINYRKRQISQLSWEITSTDVTTVKDETKTKERSKEIRNLFKYPTGDKSESFKGFVDKLVEDLVVLDIASIYRRKNRGGGLYGYLAVDSATITRVLNMDGTTPQPPEVAYLQKMDGKVVSQLTTDELIYKIMNPRTDSPYGLSLVEALVLTITTALKISSFNLSYLTDGNIPEGFIELPKDIASNQDQLQLWQKAWDAMLSGDSRYQRKVKFLPEGMKWTPIRKPEDFQFEKFEKWLMLNVCSVMEVPPQAIGFQFDRGKGATEAEWEIGKEKGMMPMAALLKEIFDQMIQEDLGHSDMEFVWTNVNPTNKLEEAKVFSELVNSGAVSVDEWRRGEGMEPIGCDNYIKTPTGVVFVKDLIKSSDAGNPILPQSYSFSGKEPADPNKPNKITVTPEAKKIADTTGVVAQKLDKVSRIEIVEELKRWKRASMNDIKLNRGFREFKSEIIDPRAKKIIQGGLSLAKSKEDVVGLFDPFIAKENQIVSAVEELYDDIISLNRE